MALHRPPLEGMELDGDVAGLVDPELEKVAVSGGVVDQGARVGTEPREEREFLASHQHVDRVDLDESHPVDDATQVPTIDAPGGAWVVEPLRAQRQAPRLSVREFGRHRRDCNDWCQTPIVTSPGQSSATVISTELITTSVFGLSPPPVGTFCIWSTTSRPFTT